jgi:transcriptional regulator with XRE-family HTH domain
MTDDATSASRDAAVLSLALKAIRKHRAMSPRQTAEAMSMAPRTYQRFEAGDTRVNLDHIHRFARATRSDAHAILMAVSIGSPEHALRSCDNQLDTIVTIAVKNLDDILGDRIRELDARVIVAAAIAFVEALINALEPDDPARTWIDDGAEALAARRPKPGR